MTRVVLSKPKSVTACLLSLQVLDYLCLADRLVEQHYKIDDVETSLELFENNGEKVIADCSIKYDPWCCC